MWSDNGANLVGGEREQQFCIHLVDMSSFCGTVLGVNEQVHDVR